MKAISASSAGNGFVVMAATAEIAKLPNETRRRNAISVDGKVVYTTLAVHRTVDDYVSGGKACETAVKSLMEGEIKEYFRRSSTIEIAA